MILGLIAPRQEDLDQLESHAADILRSRPGLNIKKHVVYTIAATGFRFF